MRARHVLLAALTLATSLRADPAHVTGVRLTRRPYAKWEVIVALEHEDVDRRHFCDRLEAWDQDGKRVFRGHFYDPRPRDVEEDGPVRRRLRVITLAPEVTRLSFRAHCKVSGWGGRALEVDLARNQGPGYRIDARGYRYLDHFEGLEKNPKIRTWRKKHLADPKRGGVPLALGPVPPLPPEPLDSRQQAKDRARIVNWPFQEPEGS
jgi:hypothetical protein